MLITSMPLMVVSDVDEQGYWHLSKTLATHTGMTNEWLKQQG
jgi:RNA-directed DNA polymerase